MGVSSTMLKRKVATEADQPKKIRPKLMAAIELLVKNEVKTQRAAAQRVGMSEAHLSVALKRPEVLAYIEQRIRQELAAGTIRAGSRMLELIHAQSEHVSFDASRHVLALANIKPPEQAPQLAVDVTVRAGYVISIEERDDPPAPKTIEHEPKVG
jgi:hypothetical protein